MKNFVRIMLIVFLIPFLPTNDIVSAVDNVVYLTPDKPVDWDSLPECRSDAALETITRMPTEADFRSNGGCKVSQGLEVSHTQFYSLPSRRDIRASSPLMDERKFMVVETHCTGKSYCNNGTTGIELLQANISAVKPTLTGGASWDDYFAGYRIHLGGGSNFVCSVAGNTIFPNLAVGMTYGKNVTGSKMRIFWERFKDPSLCTSTLTQIEANPNTSYFIQIYRSGTNNWNIRVWINSGWMNIAADKNMPFDRASYVEGGFEHYTDHSGNRIYLHVPLNFVHKLAFTHKGCCSAAKSYAMHNSVLPTADSDTSFVVESPWEAFDLDPVDFTSIAGQAN